MACWQSTEKVSSMFDFSWTHTQHLQSATPKKTMVDTQKDSHRPKRAASVRLKHECQVHVPNICSTAEKQRQSPTKRETCSCHDAGFVHNVANDNDHAGALWMGQSHISRSCLRCPSTSLTDNLDCTPRLSVHLSLTSSRCRHTLHLASPPSPTPTYTERPDGRRTASSSPRAWEVGSRHVAQKGDAQVQQRRGELSEPKPNQDTLACRAPPPTPESDDNDDGGRRPSPAGSLGCGLVGDRGRQRGKGVAHVGRNTRMEAVPSISGDPESSVG
ncbi:hypothetical protein HDK77DRAFT_282531 [Phyllosticta capitalensis]